VKWGDLAELAVLDENTAEVDRIRRKVTKNESSSWKIGLELTAREGKRKERGRKLCHRG